MNTAPSVPASQSPPARLPRSADFRTVEGWRAFQRERSATVMPTLVSRRAYNDFNNPDRRRYNRLRTRWHQNLPFIRTAATDQLIDRLQQLFETNAEAWRATSRPGGLVSGISQIGKTTTIVEAAAQFERSWREVNSDSGVGDRIIADSVPVAWATCTSKTTIKTLCLDLLNYYGDPIPRGKPTESDLARKVKNCLYQCDTKVLVIDELTRLKLHRENDQDVSDFIRDLMLSPATVVGMGVDIRKSALLGEGNNYIASSGRTALATQTSHRFSLYELEPFNDATRDGLDDWRLVLADLQQQLLLLDAPDDLLASLSSYLYERSHGVMGWLISLVQGGCAEAIASGAETLTESLLDEIAISVAADEAEAADIVAGSPERRHPRKSGRNTIYDC